MRIDFVSDVSCPWCAVGLAALLQALERLRGTLQAELHFQPFELNPTMPRQGQDIDEHLSRKYQLTPAQLESNQAHLRERGLAVGFDFPPGKRRRVFNTFDAHRLLHWAGLEGPAQQLALKQALLVAYFQHGEDPSDADVLVRLCERVGLPAERARELLAGDAHAAEVREAEAHWQGLGIHAVPAVVIDERHLIQGGQPVEAFEQALREIAEARLV